MSTKCVLFASLSVAIVALTFAQVAEARLTPPAAPVQPASLTTNLGGDCCAPTPAPACCPKPCITYRHRGPKLCCGCEAPIKTVLKVKDPCTCCEIEVPVCVPACCKGEPKVCCGAGFLGRDVVTYEWCCGYSVRVAFKHSGDLIVTTWGR